MALDQGERLINEWQKKRRKLESGQREGERERG